MNMDEKRYQIIYSRRIMTELMQRGFIPNKTCNNPQYEGYLCWLFEDTENFHKVFEELTEKKGG